VTNPARATEAGGGRCGLSVGICHEYGCIGASARSIQARSDFSTLLRFSPARFVVRLTWALLFFAFFDSYRPHNPVPPGAHPDQDAGAMADARLDIAVGHRLAVDDA
jgi:hypothetical protein